MRFEQRPKGSKKEIHVDIWGKIFHAEKKSNAKSLRSMPDMFEKEQK